MNRFDETSVPKCEGCQADAVLCDVPCADALEEVDAEEERRRLASEGG